MAEKRGVADVGALTKSLVAVVFEWIETAAQTLPVGRIAALCRFFLDFFEYVRVAGLKCSHLANAY